MLSILGTIFGSGKVIEKGLDLIDESFDSIEEKTDSQVKVIESKAKSKTDLLTAYAPFKLAQRYIAFSFTFMFIFIMLNGVLGSLYGVVELDKVKQALDFANSMWLGEIMLVIIGFYFGGGFKESWDRGKKK